MPSQACVGCGRPGQWGRGSRCPGCKTPNRHSNPARGTAAYRGLRATVLERDGYQCHWCGAPLEREPGDGGRLYELDHVTPRNVGGQDTESNTVAACRKCNRRRGARGRAA